MAHQMETTTSHLIGDSLIDDDNANAGCTDSGYSSTLGSLSSHGSSINISLARPSVSHYLQPIYENVPIQSFSKTSELTPTSQSIRRINEFHITSPLSSLKRSGSSLPCTPNKCLTPTKKMRLDGKDRSKVHRNLIDSIHVDENSENRDISNLDFSPIKAVNVLQDRNGKFERKGSFSSTPIYEDSLMKSMSVSKTDFFNSKNRSDQHSLIIRKTKSFSPSKKKWVVGRGRQVSVEATTPIPEDKELPSTPARNSVRRLLSRQDAITTFPEPSTSQFDITATDFLEPETNLHSPAIFKSPASPLPTTITSSLSSSSSISSSSHTPVKSIRRNLSFNLTQPSPKKELDKIIFSKIPCSPRKPRAPATKRPSAAKEVGVAAKRPLFDLSSLLPKRASYAHLKRFDILSNLAETDPAIKKIFSYLEPKDIYQAYNVCQNWRDIINNYGFNSQRIKFVHSMERSKENLGKKPALRRARSVNGVVKSPLKPVNAMNVRKNSLRIASKQAVSFSDETMSVSVHFFFWDIFFLFWSCSFRSSKLYKNLCLILSTSNFMASGLVFWQEKAPVERI